MQYYCENLTKWAMEGFDRWVQLGSMHIRVVRASAAICSVRPAICPLSAVSQGLYGFMAFCLFIYAHM
jgi:hypothetical protein